MLEQLFSSFFQSTCLIRKMRTAPFIFLSKHGIPLKILILEQPANIKAEKIKNKGKIQT